MNISHEEWENYIKKMAQLSEVAAEKMQKYIDIFGIDDRNKLIGIAQSLIEEYGASATELACAMYDAIAEKKKLMLLWLRRFLLMIFQTLQKQ